MLILKIILNLLIFCKCSFAQEWETPQFLENEAVKDQVKFEQTEAGVIITMNENIAKNITVAFLNYNGATEPIISKFLEPSNSAASLLGPKIDRTENTLNWEIIITVPQDYETNPIRYVFEVKVGSTSAQVFVMINNLDDTTPLIETTADNNPCKINENQKGSTKCYYKISDLDGIMNGVVKYTLSSTLISNINEIFEMKNTEPLQNGLKEWTTELIVLKELDFEKLSSYIIDFKVTDSGNQESTAKLVIEVLDLPDTPPVWITIFSSATFPEKEEQTFLVQATDGDIGILASIRYKITSKWPDLFKIDEETGNIKIEKIDRDALGIELFSFEVVAYEKDDITSTNAQIITIVVEDKNDHKPEITLNTTQVKILENKVTTLPINIEINDLDLGNNAKYKVSLVDNDYNKAFQIVPNSAYQNATFSITVINSQLLDYENINWRNLNLIIRAEEEIDKTHVVEQSVTIELENWNDEAPIFDQENYNTAVPEGIKKDYKIIQVLAKDNDYGDSVMYSLLGKEIQSMFSIDNEGVIRTKVDNTLDYEKQNLVFIQILAEDTLGEPYHRTVAQLTIDVQDVNDEQPSISVDPQPISIEENVADGTIINTDTVISASDEDTLALLEFSINWSSSYGIKNGQTVDLYEWIIAETDFNPTTKVAKAILKVKELNLNNTPDYELFDTVYISLVVTDKNQTIGFPQNNVRVTITITDVNDMAPVFVADTINSFKSVVEGATTNTRIGTITATDDDGPNHNEIIYSIKPENTPTGWVDIDPKRGELFVVENAKINADLPISQLQYIVKATNKQLSTEEKINITVIDTNNQFPECTFSSVIHIAEKSPTGTVIPQNIVCTDKDRDEAYNTPWFRFSSSATEVKNLFSIDTFTGKISVNIKGDNELNRDEGTSTYNIPFIVSDNYNQEGSIQQNMKEYNFNLILDDINDHAPIIQTITIPGNENMKKGSTLGDIVAKDIDELNTDNTKVNFEVVNVEKGADAGADPPKDLFSVLVEDEYSGKGKLIANYDLRSYYGTYIALIKAFDFGSEPKSSETEIKVIIEKYNFEPPVFVYPSPTDNQPLYLSKTQEIGQQLYQYDGTLLKAFNASDQQNEKWDIKITIEEATNPNGLFNLQKSGKSEAMLLLNSLPNFSGTLELKLIANCNCNGDEPYETNLIINIRFINDDSEPEFEDNNTSLEFPENTTGITKQLPKAYFNKEGEDWELFTPYYFLTEDISGAFEINKNSAELKLVQVLDREEVSSITLTVVSSKNPKGNPTPEKSSILNVLINVKDLNDNNPSFDKTEFYTGVKPANILKSKILSLTAYDFDIDDILDIQILQETLKPNGAGINTIQYPFYMEKTTNEILDNHIIATGDIHLNFTVQTNMDGYFTFEAKVIDQEQHEAKTSVKIYIVSESSQVIIKFASNVTMVLSKEEEVRLIFEKYIGYRCNIETIVMSTDETGVEIPDQTDIVAHFVNDETNEAVSSDAIKEIFGNYKVFSNLSNELVGEGLYLLNFKDNEVPENSEAALRAWLIGVSVVLGTLSLVLIIAFILKTRSLLSRLSKLSNPKFGSQESGLNRVGLAAPNTNKHAIEGSNPVYSDEKKAQEFDRQSIGSGDSDLIGIEDNPNFDYNYEIKRRNSANSLFKEKF